MSNFTLVWHFLIFGVLPYVRHCSLSGRQLATVYFGALQLEESKQ